VTRTKVGTLVVANSVELACRAPSLHNSQPWRWVASGTVVDLFADPTRVVRSTDSSGREALISCGAALDHFRVAMAAAGWNTFVDQFPNPNNLEHLASVDFSPLDFVTQGWRERADAILHRRTDRLAFRAPTNWESFEPVLRSSVDEDLAILDVLGDDARPQLAEASGLTESLRRYDDSYHRELQWWTAPFRLYEGVPPSALLSDSERQRVEVNRQFPLSGHSDRRAATPQDQATILVLSTPQDSRADALNCGEVLSTVLLECTMAGLATCTLTHITEMEASRDVIRGLTGREAMPPVLIRVGTAPDIEPIPAPTPRRPLNDVLEIPR
jgi:nitroreductase